MCKKLMTLVVIGLLLSLGTAWGTTRHVPDDYPTIQAAIDAAVSGDEILVAPGTYLESISIYWKHLTLRSSGGPDVTTIWGGDKPVTVVDVHSGWGNPATVIEGFEITSRYGPYYYVCYVSGITCVECSMKVVNCDVNGNHFHGIECYEAFVEVVNTRVVDNKSIGNKGGAGIFGTTADFDIQNCTIANNSNNEGGGGICVDGSIYLSKIRNSVIWGNTSSNTASGDQVWLKHSAVLVTDFSDVQGGQGDVNVETGSMLSWGLGMMDADPLFVDPTGKDYHLTYPSPCRDAGENYYVTELNDIEGDPRIVDGTVDMGADEFHAHLYFTGDAKPGENVEVKLIGPPGTSPVGLWIAFKALGTPIPGAYGDWWLLPPMMGPIFLPPIPADGVYVLPGTMPAPPAGYTLYLQAIMGTPLKLTNLCTMNVQ